MEETILKVLPFVAIAIIAAYFGYDFGGDAAAAEYADSAQGLLELILRGRE